MCSRPNNWLKRPALLLHRSDCSGDVDSPLAVARIGSRRSQLIGRLLDRRPDLVRPPMAYPAREVLATHRRSGLRPSPDPTGCRTAARARTRWSLSRRSSRRSTGSSTAHPASAGNAAGYSSGTVAAAPGSIPPTSPCGRGCRAGAVTRCQSSSRSSISQTWSARARRSIESRTARCSPTSDRPAPRCHSRRGSSASTRTRGGTTRRTSSCSIKYSWLRDTASKFRTVC